MKQLGIILESNVFPEAVDKDTSGFVRREAARTVATDSLGHIALLFVRQFNYHKLPGGGSKPSEAPLQTALRETLEETGCMIEIVKDLGYIEEHHDQINQLQISANYLARQVGEQQKPQFTDKEIAQGLEVEWVENIEAAIQALEADQPANHEGQYIQVRDLMVLKAAQKKLAA